MIYDFVGLDAMSLNPLERLITYQGNWGWAGALAASRPPSKTSPSSSGSRRTSPTGPSSFAAQPPPVRPRYYHFVGYTFPSTLPTTQTRRRCGQHLATTKAASDRLLGGWNLGGSRNLLRLCAASYPHIQERVEDVRMILVCGPRMTPRVSKCHQVEVRGYVPRLYEHLAACEVAIVQGGGTTTLELTRCAHSPSSTSLLRITSSRTWWWPSGLRGMGRASGCSTPRPRPSWPRRCIGSWVVKRTGLPYPRMGPGGQRS